MNYSVGNRISREIPLSIVVVMRTEQEGEFVLRLTGAVPFWHCRYVPEQACIFTETEESPVWLLQLSGSAKRLDTQALEATR